MKFLRLVLKLVLKSFKLLLRSILEFQKFEKSYLNNLKKKVLKIVPQNNPFQNS